MKKLVILIVFCVCGLMSQTSFAQVSFRANIALQPIWGPVGYDHVEYYYLPEIEAYYYVPSHMFYYMENGRWVNRPYLSGRYRNYDLFGARKIVINEPRPYLRHQLYRGRYANARGYSRAMSIRDSHDSRYFVISNHPEHARWNNGRGPVENRGAINHREPMNNRAIMNNRGSVDNHRGTMENRGTMDNRGTMNNRGSMNNNRGTVDNRGTMNNSNRGNTNNAGNSRGNTNNTGNSRGNMNTNTNTGNSRGNMNNRSTTNTGTPNTNKGTTNNGENKRNQKPQ